MDTQIKIDDENHQWFLEEEAGFVQLWHCPTRHVHKWAMCYAGDEPDHATFRKTTLPEIAHAWFDKELLEIEESFRRY
jgi:hypothetical protein